MNIENITNNKLIVVLGPTATGKTQFATQLANAIDGEIISADSRQVYERMDIGTGKDISEYTIGTTKIPYHLIDICQPGTKYNVYQYQKDFIQAFKKINVDNKAPILCGGTGMYIEAVTKGYRLIPVPDNEDLRSKLQHKSLTELEEILSSFKTLHNKSDTDTVKRAIRAIEIEDYYSKNPEIDFEMPPISPLYFGILVDRDTRRMRITERLKNRLEEGMIQEVESLLNEGIPPEDLIFYGLEYKYVTLFLTGKMNYDEMFQKLNTSIHQFAKRQMTWFRKMERAGIQINWVNGLESDQNKIELALRIINDTNH